MFKLRTARRPIRTQCKAQVLPEDVLEDPPEEPEAPLWLELVAPEPLAGVAFELLFEEAPAP